MTGPVKRSLTIAGHATSVTLEPVFWEALAGAAVEEGASLAGLAARIDAARLTQRPPPNLASAIRVWLMERALSAMGCNEDPAELGGGTALPAS